MADSKSKPRRDLDQRSRQTRAAIIGAFNELFIAQRYDEISVRQIIVRAGVGRSTFYEHFRNKDQTLRASVVHVLNDIADAALPNADAAMRAANIRAIAAMLDHFHENQRRARALLNGPSASTVTQVLAEMIAERMKGDGRPRTSMNGLPLALTASQIAEAHMGLIRAWLDHIGSCSSDALARAIHQSTQSLVASSQTRT